MEEFFRLQNGRLIKLPNRNPNKQYRYAQHPETRVNCYIELTTEEEAQRIKDRDDAIARIEAEAAIPTLEQRIAVIEQRLNIDPPGRPRNNR